MTGPEKAAVLLLRLPPSEADGVLARLDRERGEHLRAHMQRLRQSPPPAELVNQILDDLDQILRGQAQTAPAATAVVPESPAEPTDRLPDEASIEADPLSALRAMTGAGPEHTPRNEERLALALGDEHPRTVALVLSQMEPDPAGMVLKRLSPEMRRAVSLQLGKDINVNLDLVGRIVRTVLAKCRSLAETPPPAPSTNRFKRMAEMLRCLDKPERMEILVALEQNDAEAAAEVKEFLYSFDDLVLVEDRSMQKLLAEIDAKSLATALKGAADAIRQKVSSNLSKRARETLNEEMELLGTVPATTIQQAQKAVVDVIQRLDQAGELTMLQ
jgi:flagellar motor switch protein FliG